jgi:hypothetical protein
LVGDGLFTSGFGDLTGTVPWQALELGEHSEANNEDDENCNANDDAAFPIIALRAGESVAASEN